MIKSILLPVDGSTYTESVLEYGKYLAGEFQAALRILTVVDIRLYEWNMAAGTDSFVPVVPSSEFQEESQRIQEEKADRILEKADNIFKNTQIPYSLHKMSGIPVDEICQAGRTSDLVVLGVRGEYERWRNKLLGATVEAVTRQINTSCLLVDKTFVSVEHIHCGYDASKYAVRALQMSAFIASHMKKELHIITVSDSEEEGQAVLDEAAHYLQPYGIPFKLHLEKGDAAEVLVNFRRELADSALTIIGSYGHSRLREAILGSTTVDVMRRSQKPVLLAK